MKRAAIYVRTSSEHQGEKASPKEQERDCRQLAEDRGLSVFEVYRDIKKYRSKRKLVEPSGSRSDRPGLLRMLADARAGKFDVILAWKEDRLYRDFRPMLSVQDAVEEAKLEIMLAKETYNPEATWIKVGIARQYLKDLKQRMSMGVKARLRSGKANTGQDRYGYERNGEVIEIVEEEAQWVRQIFAWYVQRVSIMEIRERLIEAGAPQKGSSVPRKIRWARSSIQAILGAAEVYATGVKTHSRDGEEFEIPVPKIIDDVTYQRFLKVREANKSHPSRNIKRDYLVGGLIYCPCERKWGARTNKKKLKSGELRLYGVYFCGQRHKEAIHPDCPRTIGSKKADNIVWERVVAALDDPELFLAGARRYVANLRNRAEQTAEEQQRLQDELDALTMERQRVITWARKGRISEDDLDYQLGEMDMRGAYLQRELAGVEDTTALAKLEDWEDQARAYLEELRLGIEELNDASLETEEERRRQFEIKRELVQILVNKVQIGKDREIKVELRLDVLALVDAPSEECEVQMAGTYNRRRSCPLHLRRAACG